MKLLNKGDEIMIGGLNFTLLLIASCAIAAIYIYGIFRITSDLMG